jgi:hypothetical protein
MIQKLYVLVNTDIGKAENICSMLNEFEEVTSAHCVTGPYDIIVLLETDNIRDVVVNRIQKMNGITSTITCLCV